MTFKALRLEIADGIARVTFTDAARGNPVDGDMCRDLRDATGEIAASAAVRSVLISAEGSAFSYGGDIAAFMEHFDDLPAVIAGWAADLNQAVINLQQLDAPVVAAVQGICAGGMVGLAAGADVVVASPTAQFVAAYAGIGYCCDGGSSVTVSRRIGQGRARGFFLLNQTIKAPEALNIGLIDELVREDGYALRAEELAVKLARGPTRALGEMRRLLSSAQFEPLGAQLALEAEALARCAGRAEAREGLIAFSEKRRPDFVGVRD